MLDGDDGNISLNSPQDISRDCLSAQLGYFDYLHGAWILAT